MRHATGELTDGFHLLRLGELLARLAQLAPGLAENALGAPALHGVGRQDEARHCDAAHEYEVKRRGPLVHAPGKRTASKEDGFPDREAQENECGSGGIARTAAQCRPQRRQHCKNGQRRSARGGSTAKTANGAAPGMAAANGLKASTPNAPAAAKIAPDSSSGGRSNDRG